MFKAGKISWSSRVRIKSVYVTQAMAKKFGGTEGCAGCFPDQAGGSTPRYHSAECRKRFSDLSRLQSAAWGGGTAAAEAMAPPAAGDSLVDGPVGMDVDEEAKEMVQEPTVLYRGILQKRRSKKAEENVKNGMKKNKPAENRDQNKMDLDKEDIDANKAFAFDKLHGEGERSGIERGHSHLDLAAHLPEGFGEEEPEAGRNDEFGRVHRFSVWSKFRLGVETFPGWDGKV